MKKVYAVRIKVNKTQSWIELKRTYTYKEARNSAEKFLNDMQMKIVAIPRKAKQEELHARWKQGVKTRKSTQKKAFSPEFSVDQSHVCLKARAKSVYENLY